MHAKSGCLDKAKLLQITILSLLLVFGKVNAATSLADKPLFSGVNVPGNVALTISAEFPTALTYAYKDTDSYSTSNTYAGYFDDKKCYQYDTTVDLFNTGVDSNGNLLTAGTKDPHWTVTSAPSGYGTGVMDVARDNLWLDNSSKSTTSKSIGLQSGAPQYSDFIYSTSFILPGNISASSLVVSFSLGHDDNLVSINVNGVSTGISSNGFSSGDSITLNSSNSSFVSGATNTIAITIRNNDGEAGMKIDNMKIMAGTKVLRNTGGNYFIPAAAAADHICSGLWSGNFLNWATMQSLDPFRQTLTGGNRVIDTSTVTVLEKAWSSGQGGDYRNRSKSISNTTLISQSTPFLSWSNFYIRIDMLGNKMWYSGSTSPSLTAAASLASVASTTVIADTTSDTSYAAANKIYEKYVRVKVCDSASNLESNCFQYPGGNYKPIGLIQKNAMKLRFSAFGYLADPAYKTDNDHTGTYNDTTQARNQALQGGVLRAKMASLGPLKPVPNAPDADNSGADGTSEWDANTGIFKLNPDAASASATASNNGISASAVPNSGVINYLNKFGSTAGRYKVYDRTAELYYTAIRYFKNIGNVSAYTDMVGYSTDEKRVLIDGFPVIKSWNDPIDYSCQANFIIGIGDNNTYAAGNLPGSKSTSGTVPTEVTNDKTVDVSIATNRVGALQGLGDIGNGNTRLMGGLAFDSHIRDIRTDDRLPGNQTISTYWLDVLEGLPEGGFVANNQYVLATKFGGFDVPEDYKPCYKDEACPTPPPTKPTTATGDASWDKDANGKPDNYFEANNPANMQTSLTKAFDDILTKTNGSSSAFAVSSPDVSTDDMSYATSYTVDGWTGDVLGNKISVSNGVATTSRVWNAATKLETQNWDTGRYIATANCSVYDATDGTQQCTGIRFRLDELSSGNKSNLVATDQKTMLNFLRGDRSNAGTLGTKTYRDRTKILADIVNSKVVAVGAPRANYTDEYNPGYAAFKSNNSGRLKVAYVGANDGMLHAFNGSALGGNELFAYIPQALFSGPNNTPTDDGLVSLAKTSYVHHYYVDSTPVITDVNFGGGNSDWHSLLVGGLGKGGKAYYALDVTNPDSLSNEGNLAAAVKWEFKHKHLGYTYGQPVMVKTAKYGWVVIMVSGYNNDDGNGYFFIVDPKNGKLLENPIPTYTSSPGTTNEAGLASVTAFVASSSNFTADSAYAADLLGNVWRLDLTCNKTDKPCDRYPAPTLLASLKSSSNVAQPVTVAPVVEFDQSTLKRYVFVGTGKLLADSDITNKQEQTFYAINDGTQTAFFTGSTAPVAFPFTRGNMINDTTTWATGVSTNVPSNMVGWYIDLGFGSNGIGYRINVDMESSAGVISFIANLTGGDACNPSGSNRTYALTYGTGKSAFSSENNIVQPYVGSDNNGLGTALTIYNTSPYDSSPKIVTCNDTGKCDTYSTDKPATAGFKQLNWRELPNPN